MLNSSFKDSLIQFDGQVAIVTGAAQGLGRAHALELARRGAKVVINDLGVSVNGERSATQAALQVVEAIRSFGGEAMASSASVADAAAVEAMVNEVMDRWGRIDILVNNAGFLRDRSFSKMSLDDMDSMIQVHLMGSLYCTKAVWDIMKSRKYGRIVMTTSSSGLYGNFGQGNYAAAKMGVVGLMQTLAIEGEKYGIKVNCLAPSAATRMTEELFSAEDLALLNAESVTPGLVYLLSRDAPTKTILCAGAGTFSIANITLTQGVHIGERPYAAEALRDQAEALFDRSGEDVPKSGFDQSRKELMAARHARGGVTGDVQ